MTRLLFDTSALVLGFSGYARLPRKVRAAFEDGAALRFVSVASIYEIGWKQRLGKLSFTPAMLKDGVAGSGLRFRSATSRMMERASTLDWAHRDPFDRMIAAAALEANAALVSSDAAFDAAPGVKRIWD